MRRVGGEAVACCAAVSSSSGMSRVTDRPRTRRGVEMEVALSTSAAWSTVHASTRSMGGEAWAILVGVAMAWVWNEVCERARADVYMGDVAI